MTPPPDEIDDEPTDPEITPTGHSRELRNRLREAREKRGLSQDDVGILVARRIGRPKRYSNSAVSSWEAFERHPPIDAMAAWARVVGLRLHVELDDAASKRRPVLLHERTRDVARVLDNLSDEDFRWAVDTIRRGIRR